MAQPVNGSTHLIPAYYSIYRPRKDERLSWPSWRTYSGQFTQISGHPSAAGWEQDRESSPARDRRSTTVPCHQLPSSGRYTISVCNQPTRSTQPCIPPDKVRAGNRFCRVAGKTVWSHMVFYLYLYLSSHPNMSKQLQYTPSSSACEAAGQWC